MKKVWNGIEVILLLLIILICILPFAYMFFMSFKSTLNAYDFHFSFSEITLEHYKTIFSKPEIFRYFMNSLFVSVAGVILTLITSCLAGYAFARLRFKGSQYLLGFNFTTSISTWSIYRKTSHIGSSNGSH